MKKNKKCKKVGADVSVRPLKWMIILIIFMVIAILIYHENKKTVICLDPGHGGTDVRFGVHKWQTL